MVRVTRDARLLRLGLLQRDLALLLGVTPLTISRRLNREEAREGSEGDRTVSAFLAAWERLDDEQRRALWREFVPGRPFPTESN